MRWVLCVWQEQQQKNSAGGRYAGDGCIDGIVAPAAAAVVGLVRADGDGRGLAW